MGIKYERNEKGIKIHLDDNGQKMERAAGAAEMTGAEKQKTAT